MGCVELLNWFINELSLNMSWESGDDPCSFFVHTSIINKWEKIMNKMFTNSDWEMYEHILEFESKLFEMRLIILLRATEDQLNFLRDSIKNSQFSFPWEENPTLFIKAAKFITLKKFIKFHNLEAYVLKIEEKVGYCVYGDHPINVITFHQSVSAKLDIVHEFKKCYDRQDHSLFVLFSFPWQQSYFLQKIHLNHDLYSTLPIILSHLGTLNYANDLDIIDLLSLRLAISDIRDPSKSKHLKDEIDFIIKQGLDKFAKNNPLSIYEYLCAKNRKPSALLMYYLVYEFQNFFDTFDMVQITGKSITLRDTINLKEEIDVFKKLQERFDVDYRIDGKGFDKMSLSLLVDLIESKNVHAIDLDTNYRWINNESMFEPNRIIAANKHVNIYLKGKNIFNFIERFVAELKIVKFHNNCLITLHIYKCNLDDYRIFDNLQVSEIQFFDIKIDLNVLENFQQCNIEPRMILFECSLKNSCRNWQLLNNLEKLSVVEIYEDEATWLSMFEFISEEIRISNTNEFRFNLKLLFGIIQRENHYSRILYLNEIKFTIDEQNSKLEIRYVDTNKIIDLYCEKYQIQEEEKSDYEFYE